MKPTKNSFQVLEKGGNHINDKNKASLSTPRQEWLKKEKQLKIKFYLLFFLSHALWPLSLYTSEPTQKPLVINQQLEENHYMIQVPANVLTTKPKSGKKIAVSVIFQNNIIFQSAYLHAVVSSQNSPTGVTAKLEIPKSEVYLLKNLRHKILEILPPIQVLNTSTKLKKGAPLEITI